MPRKVKEWIGKTPDSRPPPKVRLRVFRDHGGICFFAGRKIMPGEAWDCHHKDELWEGGENRESNLRPALRKYHRAHSAKQKTVKAESDRKALAILGQKEPKTRGFSATYRGRAVKQKIGGGLVYRDTNEQV